MTSLQPIQLSEQHKQAVFNLWNKEYPASLTFHLLQDLDQYLEQLHSPLHCFMEDDRKALVAWAVAFERDSETWFAIIVNSALHKKGFGSHLLRLLKERHACLNGWVIDHNTGIKANGEPYASPLGFYLKNDFEICNTTRLETEKLSAVKIKWKKHEAGSGTNPPVR